MFARALNVSMNGVARATAAAIVLVVGNACKGVDCLCIDPNTFTAFAWGANVVPAAPDTSARASLSFNSATLSYTYKVTTPPSGTIDSIALYDAAPGQALPVSATVILCAGAAACAVTSGMGTLVPPATTATITTSLRAYTTQVVFFTTTAPKAAGGAMRGTMYPTLQ